MTPSVRAGFISQARDCNFEITGYYFESKRDDCWERNQCRSGKEKVPDVALFSKISELEIPKWEEGFSKLFYVRIGNDGFEVEDWIGE